MRFDGTISLGSVITLVTSLTVVGVLYGTADARITSNEVAIDRLKAEAAERENRLRRAEIQQAGQSSDLRSIKEGIAEIKTLLSEMRQRRGTEQ